MRAVLFGLFTGMLAAVFKAILGSGDGWELGGWLAAFFAAAFVVTAVSAVLRIFAESRDHP